MLINDVMTRGAVTCHADHTLEHATNLMWDYDIGFLPVVDYTNRLIGVITDRDILMCVYTCGARLSGKLVDNAMAHSPITCTVHDSAAHIEQRMAQHQVRRIPVIDHESNVIGIVTLADIARASLRGHDLSSRAPTSTLAAITRPRFPALTSR